MSKFTNIGLGMSYAQKRKKFIVRRCIGSNKYVEETMGKDEFEKYLKRFKMRPVAWKRSSRATIVQ